MKNTPAWKLAKQRQAENARAAGPVDASSLSLFAAILGDIASPDDKAAAIEAMRAKGVISDAGAQYCLRVFCA